jgi:hypothetical protein
MKLTGRWKGLRQAIDPKTLNPVLIREVGRATKRNGKLAERSIRRAIQKGIPPGNAALTQHIKGSSKPLVDTGTGIWQAITSVAASEFEVFVGVLRQDRHYDIAETLHNGVAIRVTQPMRGLFAALWQASTGKRDPGTLTGRARELWDRRPGGWLPLAAETVVIKIPPRPFIDLGFRDPELKRRCKEEWEQAIQRALVLNARKG